MLVMSVILRSTNVCYALQEEKMGADKDLKSRFIELGYQYAPIAIISLIVGLGAKLFELLGVIGFDEHFIQGFKLVIFGISFLWSLWLAWRILANQGVIRKYRIAPILPGAIGSIAVGLAWWPSIFGM